MSITLTFYVSTAPELIGRIDSRVRVLDHDDVTLTSRVEFPDGFRAVVRDADLVTREA